MDIFWLRKIYLKTKYANDYYNGTNGNGLTCLAKQNKKTYVPMIPMNHCDLVFRQQMKGNPKRCSLLLFGLDDFVCGSASSQGGSDVHFIDSFPLS